MHLTLGQESEADWNLEINPSSRCHSGLGKREQHFEGLQSWRRACASLAGEEVLMVQQPWEGSFESSKIEVSPAMMVLQVSLANTLQSPLLQTQRVLVEVYVLHWQLTGLVAPISAAK